MFTLYVSSLPLLLSNSLALVAEELSICVHGLNANLICLIAENQRSPYV